MSQDNVEIVRRGLDAFNGREFITALERFDPDAEWIPYLAALEDEIYRGRDQIEAMWREVLRDFPDFRIELMEVVADRKDTVVAKVEFKGMGRASGADIHTVVFQAASFRDGRVIRVQGFRDRAEALKATGLSE